MQMEILAEPPNFTTKSTQGKHLQSGNMFDEYLHMHRRQEIQQLLQEMQEKDVIQKSTSPWAAPIILVRKKDGTTRFCVDYRKLNEVTRKDVYPLPRIDATLDALTGTQWLDLLSGYWQVEVAEEHRKKTAFCTIEGLFKFKVMPFGLCNAPAMFQRLMDLLLARLQWSHCLVYLDNVIILGIHLHHTWTTCGPSLIASELLD